MTRDARTKISLISQCEETHLSFPDKRHVKATRGARAVCCDSDPPWPGPGSPVQPPSQSAHLNHQLRSQKDKRQVNQSRPRRGATRHRFT